MKVEKMKESRRRLSWLPKALLATLLAGALAFVGCKSDDDDDDPEPVLVEKITLNFERVNLGLENNKTIKLKATVEPDTATDKKITWSVSGDDGVVTITPLTTQSGEEVTVEAQEKGSVTIIATAQGGTDKKAECVIAVTDRITPIEKIEISSEGGKKTIDADESETLVLTATVTPGEAENADNLSWKSSDPSVAKVVEKNSANPRQTTVTAVKKGKVTITAFVVEEGKTKEGTFNIEVTGTESPQNPGDPDEDDDDDKTAEDYAAEDEEAYGEAQYELSFADVELDDIIGVYAAENANSEITADGVWHHYYVANASGPRIAWLKENEELTAATTDTSYVLAFDAALTQGEAGSDFFLVNTVVQTDNNIKPHLLKLTAAGNDTWTINGSNPDDTPFGAVTLVAGKFYHYTLKVTNTEDGKQLVLLTIAGAKDEAGNLVKDVYLKVNGTSYAAKSFCLGVTTRAAGGEQSLKNVKIYNYEAAPEDIPATKVKITNKEVLEVSLPLSIGGTLEPEVTLTPFYTTDTVKWSSTDSDIADVDEETGLITAKGEGKATITATAGTKTDSIEIEVTDKYIPVESVKITTTTKKIGLTQPVKFKAEVTPPNATNANKLKWSIKGDGSIAEIDATSGAVTGKNEGKVTIVAAVEDDEDSDPTHIKSAESEVTVVLYYEDFDYKSLDTTTTDIIGIKDDDTHVVFAYARDKPTLSLVDGAFKIDPRNSRSVHLSNRINGVVPEAGRITVSFDANVTATSAGKTQQLALLTEVPTGYDTTNWENTNNNVFNRNYLFALNNDGSTFTLNGNSLSNFAANTWYRFTVYITYDGGEPTVSATIRNRDTDVYVFGDANTPASLNLPASMESYAFKAIHLMGNKDFGAWTIDNIEITTVTE